MTTGTKALIGAVALAVLVPGVAAAAPPPALGWSAPWADLVYEPAFDYDNDGCYPTPAIGSNGVINPGLAIGGAVNGNCHDASDLANTNAYSRSKCNNGWCAYMYDLYFEKDQTADGGGAAGSHRNDWEHVIIWVKDGNQYPLHVSVSQHGEFKTYPRNSVDWDDTGVHAKVVYHKDGVRTHCFRVAAYQESISNHRGAYQYPPLVGWNNYPAGFRDRLTSHDFGSATFALKDDSFSYNLNKAKPTSIPFNPYG